MLTPVEKAMCLLDQCRGEPKKETLCEVLHIIEGQEIGGKYERNYINYNR